MGRIIYAIVYALVWTIAWIPLPALYLLSDIGYVLIYYIVRYRRKVVHRNLCNSFPNKSEAEIFRIEKRFYLHLCDIFIEAIHLIHISEKEMRKRMFFTNLDLLNTEVENGKNGILMLGHYGNWEYMVAATLFADGKYAPIGVYREQKNKYVNDFFLKLRTKFGTQEIEKNKLFREIISFKRKNIPFAFAIMADQTPSTRNLHYWTNFLNQDTPVLTGGERIARQTCSVVFYVDIICKKRGYYEATLIPLGDNVPDTPEYELTEQYIRLMEKTILRDPAYWLWSHKRWKHKRNLTN